jgi:hypothetical protein
MVEGWLTATRAADLKGTCKAAQVTALIANS